MPSLFYSVASLSLSVAYKFTFAGNFKTRTHLLDYINLGQVGALCVSVSLVPHTAHTPCRARQTTRRQHACRLTRRNDTTHKTLFVCLSAWEQQRKEEVRGWEWSRARSRGRKPCVFARLGDDACLCICLGFFGFCFFVSPHGSSMKNVYKLQ